MILIGLYLVLSDLCNSLIGLKYLLYVTCYRVNAEIKIERNYKNVLSLKKNNYFGSLVEIWSKRRSLYEGLKIFKINFKEAVSPSAHLFSAYCFNFENTSETVRKLLVVAASVSTKMLHVCKVIFKLLDLQTWKSRVDFLKFGSPTSLKIILYESWIHHLRT